jgi:multimeric flavodoxin WrbA
MAAKIQVIFYSMYGHVYRMAEAIAAGARDAGGEVSLWQVPELVPDEILERNGAAVARTAFAHVPLVKPAQLEEADAIIFGTPTRFGNMAAQMRNFLDQTGGLWGGRCARGHGGERIRQHRIAARRSGDHPHQFPSHLAAPRYHRRRRPLHRAAADEHGRNHWRHRLWRDDFGRPRRLSRAQ